MKSFPVKLSLEHLLELTKQFPKGIKKILIKEWTEELENESEGVDTIDLSLEGYDEPIDLGGATFTESMLQPLKELWKDELPAEELVEMLTK